MPGAYGTADPLFLLLSALALEAYLGGQAWLVRLLGLPRRQLVRLSRSLERRLNRPARGRRSLLVRGLLVTVFLVLLALVAGWLVIQFTRGYPFAWILELVLLLSLLRQRASWSLLARIRAALAVGGLQTARDALARLSAGEIEPRLLERLDLAAVTTAGLHALARRFADSLVAPVFWFLLLGLPGLLAQQAVQVLASLYGGTLSSQPGHQPRSGEFGLPAVWLHRAICWLPDKIAGLILVAAAVFAPGAMPGPALARLGGESWAVTALGGALGLTREQASDDLPLTGALVLFAVACLVHAGLLAVLLVVRLGPVA